MANGAPFAEIAANLEQIETQPIAGASKETRDWDAQVRSTQARKLLKLYQRSGAQAVRERVAQQLQMPRIVVHR